MEEGSSKSGIKYMYVAPNLKQIFKLSLGTVFPYLNTYDPTCGRGKVTSHS